MSGKLQPYTCNMQQSYSVRFIDVILGMEEA